MHGLPSGWVMPVVCCRRRRRGWVAGAPPELQRILSHPAHRSHAEAALSACKSVQVEDGDDVYVQPDYQFR